MNCMPSGKYESRVKYSAVRLQRGVLRCMIRPLVKWQRMPQTREGYTVIIGCKSELHGILAANLDMLTAQDTYGLHEIIVVFDRSRRTMARAAGELQSRFSMLPLRFEFYSRSQAMVASAINWAWVYAWLSWMIGVRATETRYAILHDLDAMLLRPDILRERFEQIRAALCEYMGVGYYSGNGVVEEDRLVKTFELAFDAEYVRRRFRPIDLFNHVTIYNGRTVDFDTTLHAQSIAGRKKVLPIDPEDMVHPSQLICQFTETRAGRQRDHPVSSLLLIPYFMYLGDENDAVLASVTGQLLRSTGGEAQFLGLSIRASTIDAAHGRWLAKQAFRLEVSRHGVVREPVREYFSEVLRWCDPQAAIAEVVSEVAVEAGASGSHRGLSRPVA
jgi:hypothetical protein